MSRVKHLAFLAALCGCASNEPSTAARLGAVEFDAQQTTARVEAAEQLLYATRQELTQLRSDLADARILVLVGGPPRRWRGGGVSCDGGKYLPGSWGESAHRALEQTGYCDPAKPTVLVSQ